MKGRKLLASILSITMVLSLLSACGGDKGGGDAADSQGGEQEVSTEETEDSGHADSAQGMTEIPMGNESGFVMDLPQGYSYDSAWSCYSSDSAGVRIWVPDVNFYETENEFNNLLEEHESDRKEIELDGILSAWIYEDPAGFYGAETHYCISLGDYYPGKSGFHLLVSSEAGDMASTQTQDIIDAVKTVRREGEGVNDRAELFEQMNADPYESLVIDFTPAETGAMSSFMSGGFYAVEGDTVYGEAYDSDGTVEFVRIELKQNGSFAEADSHLILEKGIIPKYVTLYGDDVYYIHGGDGSGIYKIPKEGGTPQLVIEDAVDYLQIRGDKLYYCDSSYTFRKADLDGSNSVPVLDKEVYYAYFVNDQWFIYQDDADNESLHLRHALKGEDITLCPDPGYSPVIYGKDLYFVTSSKGKNVMAKIDMTYDAQSKDNFSIEYGTQKQAADITISTEGYLFYGLKNGLTIDRWEDAKNPDKKYEKFYRYLGDKYEIFWEFDDQGRNAGIYVTLLSESSSQSLPRLD